MGFPVDVVEDCERRRVNTFRPLVPIDRASEIQMGTKLSGNVRLAGLGGPVDNERAEAVELLPMQFHVLQNLY